MSFKMNLYYETCDLHREMLEKVLVRPGTIFSIIKSVFSYINSVWLGVRTSKLVEIYFAIYLFQNFSYNQHGVGF